MQDNTMSLQPEEATEEEEVVDGPLFIDLSKIDDKGRFPAFCGKCMIIGNITLDHARECPLSKRCNKSCKDNNDDPLSLWICRCCVYRPGLAESYRPHLVPVQACPPSSYYDPTSPPSRSYYYPTSNYYPTSEPSANAMVAQQPGALLAGGSNKGPYSDVMNKAENAKKKAREF